jgi:hypothetical protein
MENQNKINTEELWKTFKDLLLSTKRENIEQLIDWLDKSDFKIAPGSARYHHSWESGLLQHSLEVYYNLHDFKDHIKFFNIPEESLIIMSLLHDICKVNMYKVSYRNTKDENGNWIKVPYYEYDELEPIGHAEKSIMLIYENGVQLTKLERACIRNHMGFSEQDVNSRVSSLFGKCPQSLLLYWADLQSTYIQGNKELQPKFKSRLVNKNIHLSLLQLASEEVRVNGILYKLAPVDAEVDEKEIILVHDDAKDIDIKVISPHKDGLPF